MWQKKQKQKTIKLIQPITMTRIKKKKKLNLKGRSLCVFAQWQ